MALSILPLEAITRRDEVPSGQMTCLGHFERRANSGPSAPDKGGSHRESQVQVTRPPSVPSEEGSQGQKQVQMTVAPDETTSCQPVWAQSVTAGSTMVELRGVN